MSATTPNRSNAIRALLLWIAAAALALTGTAFFERQGRVAELTTQSAILHRLASQRADQHDAHLTSLSAIFVVGGAERQDLFLEVTASITRFYPRIASIHIVPFDPERQGIHSQPSLSDEDAALVRRLANGSLGQVQIAQSLARPDHYIMVKRTPNTDTATHALALVVQAEALIATDDPFWKEPTASRRLVMPDGQVLVGRLTTLDAVQSKPLGSQSQPLVLETSLAISSADILPAGRIVLILALVTALFLITAVFARQRTRRQAAERSAALSAQEARLAHASRVNSMGEMASGMAHELAQPLTAILSQAQAGRRLVRRGDVNRLESVLDDTVVQAQRAADILERLRRWSRPNSSDVKNCSLNDAVRNVERLLAREAETHDAEIVLDLSEASVMVKADPVELEQVIFNLMRNALEAADGVRITIATKLQGRQAVLEITDTGPGIPEHLKERIFEPFVTGKPNGTGLGLALCQRLVEGMDGDIELLPDTDQTTFRLTFPHADNGQSL